ncbi:glutathione S-transferase [Aspergillus karnatakaensis]|uniref:glutathione S-transferase n=1 Tax=Aspergillus karnatakaensis TaxID=1810916 RepID=UPI003CCE528A
MSQPVYHYLTLGRLGRGEVLNLFLKDAAIDKKDVFYPYDHTWPETSEKLKQDGLTRTGLLPALEYKGSIYTQHIPTLRYLARELNSYDGETNQEKYLVDAVADIYIDWRAHWVASLKGATAEYKDVVVPKYYNLVAQYYADTEGPYLLGDRITYVDFAIYQSIDNDRRTGTLPASIADSLKKLEEAIEARPNIKEYIQAAKQ